MARPGFLKSLGAALNKVLPRGGGQKSSAPTAPAGAGRSAAPAPTGAVGGFVKVEYAPNADGRPDPGEVVWTWVPYEDDPAQGKDRPVVAIGWDGARLVVVPFTSKDQHGRPDTYEIGSGQWDVSGRPSWVKLDRLIGVDAGSVRREGAGLDRERFAELIRRLHAVHGTTLRVTG
jgi:hypothetical protein